LRIANGKLPLTHFASETSKYAKLTGGEPVRGVPPTSDLTGSHAKQHSLCSNESEAFVKHTQYAKELTCKHLFFRCQLMYFESDNVSFVGAKAKLSPSSRILSWIMK